MHGLRCNKLFDSSAKGFRHVRRAMLTSALSAASQL